MKYLETNDLGKLFNAAYEANRTHHLALITAYWTGARVSQVLSLTGRDIFQLNGIWMIRIGKQKRGLEADHKLHVDANHVLDMSPLVDLAKRMGRNRLFGGLSRQYLDIKLKAYGASVSIHVSYLHAHVLRHSIAMEIWTRTQRLGTITSFLQHRSPTSALQYLAENDNRLAQDAVDQVSFA